jgi:hypothetical protein
MRDRLVVIVERLFDAADDDPLVIAAGALVVIAVGAVLIAVGILAASVIWFASPWSLVALPLLAVLFVVLTERRGR